MKHLILIIFFTFFISCHRDIEYTNVKNHLIYKDNKDNIYLRRKVFILRRDDFESKKKDGYFDMVVYKDSVIQLKKLIEIESFNQIKKADTFIDKNFIYIFNDKPNVFPSIEVFERNENFKPNYK